MFFNKKGIIIDQIAWDKIKNMISEHNNTKKQMIYGNSINYTVIYWIGF